VSFPFTLGRPAARSRPLRLEHSYRRCRAITRTSSKTFYLASCFLPREKRRAVWAIYAFCRTVDDVADGAEASSVRLTKLDAWQAELFAAFSGQPEQPLMAALADTVRRYDIAIRPALQLLQGARSDITVRRYETYDELLEYCYLVASTVGLLVSPILGHAPGASEYAIALGRAMQLTNILRDVGEDARRDRVYLPAEDLRRFGYTEDKLLRGVVDSSFVALMSFQIARVRAMYRAAAPGIGLLAPESRYTVRLALRLYARILDEIERNGYDVFTRRAYVPIRAKFVAAMTTAFTR